MGIDNFTVTDNRSWFNRIGSAFKGIVIGLITIIAGFVMLFWNEGRAVERYKTLIEGGGVVLSIPADRVDPGNEGKLVHLTGVADSQQTLIDQEFGVKSQSIKLIRNVEMFQWKESSKSETKKKLGGGEETITTYSYSKDWVSRAVDSNAFKKSENHRNPGTMVYQPRTLTATKVEVGAFRLSPSLVNKISPAIPFSVAGNYTLPESLSGKIIPITNGFYLGKDPSNPEVGDHRISYTVVMPGEVSLIAKQILSSFEPYHTKAGGAIEMLEMGLHSADSMFQKAQHSNTILTWLLRGGGFLILLIGLKMVLAPLGVIADIVPMIGSMVGVGTTLVAALLSAVLSFVTIGIAWLFYRPLLGGILLAVATVLCFFIFIKVKKTEPVPPPIPPPIP